MQANKTNQNYMIESHQCNTALGGPATSIADLQCQGAGPSIVNLRAKPLVLNRLVLGFRFVKGSHDLLIQPKLGFILSFIM